MKNPIKKLIVFGTKFDDGTKFEIVHDLPEKTFDKLFKQWYDMPLPFAEDSLILFVKINYPSCICVKKSDYDKVTKGKVIHVTKEEYEAENN